MHGLRACSTNSIIMVWKSMGNGEIASFNGELRNELFYWEIFTTLFEAKVLIKQWQHEYNCIRPHSALGYRPPVPVTVIQDLRPYIATLEV